MRKLFLLGLTLVLLTACQNTTERYTTTSTNIDEVKALLNDYESGNWDAWSTHYVDTAKIFHNTWKTGSTPAETQEALKAIVANTSSYGFDKGEENLFLEQTIDDDGKTWVNFWGNWRGTLAANSQEIEIPVHLSVEMVDGKIVSEYGFYDVSQMQAALQAIEMANNMPVEEKAMKDAIDKVVLGWNTHDISNLRSLTGEKFVRTANGTVIANNVDEYEQFMNTFVTGFPDFAVKVDKYDSKGNEVYIYWTVTGTNNGEFMGNAPTGKKIVTHGFSVWNMNKDGKFTIEDAFYDNLDLYNQLGLTPPKS